MTKLINFEEMFHEYFHGYMHKHEINDDVMDEIVPELYLRWLDMPQESLGGKSPNGCFANMGSSDLIMLLGQYFFSELQIPGALLNRIADTKQETFPFIHSLLQNFEGERGDEFKAVLVELIDEMEMPHPYEYYISVISGETESSDFSEACVDALKRSGDKVYETLIKACENAAGEYAKDCFLDILSDLPYDERVYTNALEKFLYNDSKRAFYASCLGKLGNEAALPYLEEALRQEDLAYFDYVSIRDAIEELGGEVAIERDFSGDKDYEALSNMED
jgi:hypothetical protein